MPELTPAPSRVKPPVPSIAEQLTACYQEVRHGSYLPADADARRAILDDARAAWSYHKEHLNMQTGAVKLKGGFKDTNQGQTYAGRTAVGGKRICERASMNVRVSPELIQMLDQAIFDFGHFGYKFGNPEFDCMTDRHDVVSLYFSARSPELTERLIAIARQFARTMPGDPPFEDDHLMGEQHCYGFRTEVVYRNRHLMQLPRLIAHVDAEFSEGVVAWSKNGEDRPFDLSTGEFESVRRVAATRGMELRYERDNLGFTVNGKTSADLPEFSAAAVAELRHRLAPEGTDFLFKSGNPEMEAIHAIIRTVADRGPTRRESLLIDFLLGPGARLIFSFEAAPSDEGYHPDPDEPIVVVRITDDERHPLNVEKLTDKFWKFIEAHYEDRMGTRVP